MKFETPSVAPPPDEVVAHLAQSTAFANLVTLDLAKNRITAAGARGLAEAPFSPRIDLRRNAISKDEASLLRAQFGPRIRL